MNWARLQRQHRIARLLETNAVASQGQLVTLLATDDVDATQATVSRDLEEMGAVKVRVPRRGAVYALPELPSTKWRPRTISAVSSASGWSRCPFGQPGRLRTPPGSAHVVGSALDRCGFEEWWDRRR